MYNKTIVNPNMILPIPLTNQHFEIWITRNGFIAKRIWIKSDKHASILNITAMPSSLPW